MGRPKGSANKKVKTPFVFESNVEKISAEIEKMPFAVLNIIGKYLVKDMKSTLPIYYKNITHRMTKSLGYWARKKEKDLQIGFKMFYADLVMGEQSNPLLPSVVRNKDYIVKMIADAIQQITDKD